jgi:hypothetical protein
VALEGLKNRIGVVPKFLGCLFVCTFIRVGIAQAIDLQSPESLEVPVPFKAQHVAVDGSTVATSLGDRSLDLNGTFAPLGDVNESGLRLRVTGSASWYKFLIGENPRIFGTGNTVEGNLLAGYQLSMHRLSIIGLIGGAVGESRDQGVDSTHWGAKAVVSMYATPWDHTMAYGSLSYSTITNFLQLQSKVGVKLVGNFYVGPEVNFSWRNVVPSYNNIATMRVGGHVSAASFGPVQVGVSAGWAHDRELGSGYYGGLNFYGTF